MNVNFRIFNGFQMNIWIYFRQHQYVPGNPFFPLNLKIYP
jgi:hypothetical protein